MTDQEILPPQHPPAYSLDSFTVAFNIGRTKAYEEIKKGKLKARKLGARTIITHEDAMAWLNTLPELVKKQGGRV